MVTLNSCTAGSNLRIAMQFWMHVIAMFSGSKPGWQALKCASGERRFHCGWGPNDPGWIGRALGAACPDGVRHPGSLKCPSSSEVAGPTWSGGASPPRSRIERPRRRMAMQHQVGAYETPMARLVGVHWRPTSFAKVRSTLGVGQQFRRSNDPDGAGLSNRAGCTILA